MTTFFYLNWWRCHYGKTELCLEKVNVEVNIRTHHVTCHVSSILKVTILQLNIAGFVVPDQVRRTWFSIPPP